MKNGTLKYLIIIIISIVIIGMLSIYIINSEKKLDNTNKFTARVKEEKSNINKEYLFTRKMSINEGENNYNINLKFYGETLSDKKKVISTEVYFEELIVGEYLYVDPVDNENDYSKIIETLEKKEIDKKIELYLIEDYLVLNVFRYGEVYNNILIMYDKNGLKIDEFNHKNISICKTDLINEYNIFNITYQNNLLFYFEHDKNELILYSLKPTINGFLKNKVDSYNYEEYCK